MGLNRVHSRTWNRNSALDVAFYRDNGSTGAHTTHSNISGVLNMSLLESFKMFGLGSKVVYSSISTNSRIPFFEGTTGLNNHHHHFHFDGFNKTIGLQIRTVSVIGKNNK